MEPNHWYDSHGTWGTHQAATFLSLRKPNHWYDSHGIWESNQHVYVPRKNTGSTIVAYNSIISQTNFYSITDWLSLYQNQITGTLPTELGNMSAMDYFYVDYNKISGGLG